MAQHIYSKLASALSPDELSVEDESHRHKGHAGARPGGETHFKVTVVASVFEGRSRLERQRLIHALLREELTHQIHALAIKAQTPEEDRQ